MKKKRLRTTPLKARLTALCLCAYGLLSGATQAQNPLPLGDKLRTADPSAHVWADGRLYVYSSHDLECQADFHMQDWYAFSTDDLRHWKNHGAIFSLDQISWADDYAWAPDAAYANGKYYLFYPAGTGSKNRQQPELSTKWMGIGVAESDSPTGPFTDVIGKPLWTAPYANDPAVFVDDDQRIYLYFHGRDFDYYAIEMAADLRSVKGDFIKMDMGGYEPKMEGPWVFKRGDLYYFTLPENNRALSYYTSRSATGPWQYQGIFMAEEHQANNHHSIVQYQGQWLLFYHRWQADPASPCPAKRQRQLAAEYLHFEPDGRIKPVLRSQNGLLKP